MKFPLSKAARQEHYVSDEAYEYWKTLPAEEHRHYFEKAVWFNRYVGQERIAIAINDAWHHSPILRARRDAEREAHQNELLTCSRSGVQVARKNAIIFGDTVVAFTALNAAERDFWLDK